MVSRDESESFKTLVPVVGSASQELSKKIVSSNRLPSLNALRAFRSVVTHGSITRAAQRMNISASSISRHISTLEKDLNCALFSRSNGLVLTEDGKELFAEVDSAFSGLEAFVQNMRQRDGQLHVKVVPTFAVRWLLPHFSNLANVSISSRWKGISATEEGFRVGIRYGLGDWPTHCAIKLYSEELVPVCSPGFARKVGNITTSSDFDHIPILHSEPESKDWNVWSTKWSGGYFNVQRGLHLDSLDNALRAAEEGLGAAMADVFLVADDLKSGRLVPLVNEIYPSDESYYLVFDEHLRSDHRLKRFKLWLLDEIHRSNSQCLVVTPLESRAG
ncbi:LysR substrate-binding domain-containing protein [Rhizobium sp. BT-175]|uniref:LysR substrate-binding domain-containing protein n=1 Tax=Rhizobium sp. BT-175 TaxID=2986929 RepID=UPI002235EE86|nr:LysR substrate-binding domain-containing protein [Rhizobium sp. BT-175]MCV9947661.1 LysR substrate-binding domain-containing protein [Rhizobium sp. BT-175]